ncbi:MAG: tripartite tricarboxylate transporter TctB family protein [Rhodobacterales bacterium]|nr:tripartite tricarboxylate transporter TctB family protein [Rhodobacterales bacterium]
MKPTSFDRTDAAAGILFIVLGLIFGWMSLGLDLGSPRRLGPGAFPLILAVVLTVLGLVILAGSLKSEGEELGALAWRGLLFILPAPVFFGLTVRGLGFVPSLFVTTVIAAMASLRMKLPAALALAVVVTIFSTMVFSYGLGLPFRRFGPWLSF